MKIKISIIVTFVAVAFALIVSLAIVLPVLDSAATSTHDSLIRTLTVENALAMRDVVVYQLNHTYELNQLARNITVRLGFPFSAPGGNTSAPKWDRNSKYLNEFLRFGFEASPLEGPTAAVVCRFSDGSYVGAVHRLGMAVVQMNRVLPTAPMTEVKYNPAVHGFGLQLENQTDRTMLLYNATRLFGYPLPVSAVVAKPLVLRVRTWPGPTPYWMDAPWPKPDLVRVAAVDFENVTSAHFIREAAYRPPGSAVHFSTCISAVRHERLHSFLNQYLPAASEGGRAYIYDRNFDHVIGTSHGLVAFFTTRTALVGGLANPLPDGCLFLPPDDVACYFNTSQYPLLRAVRARGWNLTERPPASTGWLLENVEHPEQDGTKYQAVAMDLVNRNSRRFFFSLLVFVPSAFLRGNVDSARTTAIMISLLVAVALAIVGVVVLGVVSSSVSQLVHQLSDPWDLEEKKKKQHQHQQRHKKKENNKNNNSSDSAAHDDDVVEAVDVNDGAAGKSMLARLVALCPFAELAEVEEQHRQLKAMIVLLRGFMSEAMRRAQRAKESSSSSNETSGTDSTATSSMSLAEASSMVQQPPGGGGSFSPIAHLFSGSSSGEEKFGSMRGSMSGSDASAPLHEDMQMTMSTSSADNSGSGPDGSSAPPPRKRKRKNVQFSAHVDSTACEYSSDGVPIVLQTEGGGAAGGAAAATASAAAVSSSHSGTDSDTDAESDAAGAAAAASPWQPGDPSSPPAKRAVGRGRNGPYIFVEHYRLVCCVQVRFPVFEHLLAAIESGGYHAKQKSKKITTSSNNKKKKKDPASRGIPSLVDSDSDDMMIYSDEELDAVHVRSSISSNNKMKTTRKRMASPTTTTTTKKKSSGDDDDDNNEDNAGVSPPPLVTDAEELRKLALQDLIDLSRIIAEMATFIIDSNLAAQQLHFHGDGLSLCFTVRHLKKSRILQKVVGSVLGVAAAMPQAVINGLALEYPSIIALMHREEEKPKEQQQPSAAAAAAASDSSSRRSRRSDKKSDDSSNKPPPALIKKVLVSCGVFAGAARLLSVSSSDVSNAAAESFSSASLARPLTVFGPCLANSIRICQFAETHLPLVESWIDLGPPAGRPGHGDAGFLGGLKERTIRRSGSGSSLSGSFSAQQHEHRHHSLPPPPPFAAPPRQVLGALPRIVADSLRRKMPISTVVAHCVAIPRLLLPMLDLKHHISSNAPPGDSVVAVAFQESAVDDDDSADRSGGSSSTASGGSSSVAPSLAGAVELSVPPRALAEVAPSGESGGAGSPTLRRRAAAAPARRSPGGSTDSIPELVPTVERALFTLSRVIDV